VRTAAATRREALSTTILLEATWSTTGLRLCATRDERRQTIDTVADRHHGLRLRLIWRLILLAVFAVIVFAGLIRLFAALLIGLTTLTLLRLFALRKGLLLHRYETRLGAEVREALALVIIFLRRHLVFGTWLRLVLPKLLLRGSDQAEIVLGVLIVVLGGNWVTGAARIAGELDVFLCDVGGGTADLDIGAIRFEDPGHRVLAAPIVIVVIIIVAVVVVPHPLVVVLTVSHVSPSVIDPECHRAMFQRDDCRRTLRDADASSIRIVVQTFAASILPSFAFNKDAFPNRLLTVPAGPNHSPAETRSGFCA
jgi:hypothetical protein